MTKLSKKEFALQQIAPYYKDKKLCASNGSGCSYQTTDGRMCVAGKNFLPKVLVSKKDSGKYIREILAEYGGVQSKVFIESSADILSADEWRYLQQLHDRISENGTVLSEDTSVNLAIERLELFTKEELIEYSNKTI